MFFPEPPFKKFREPAPGTMAIATGYPPQVRYAGSLWRIKCNGIDVSNLKNGQLVRVLGIQGNSLVIELEEVLQDA